MSYKEIKEHCLKHGYLFKDKDFPALNSSIYYSKRDDTIVWKRPRDIAQDPQFVVGSKSRFDIYQGDVGNCWYLAAVATVSTRPELFNRVVPQDQGFGEGYAGVFRFHFWRFGRWIEVVIDDELPTVNGQLVFCHNRHQPNEFWAPLLEKAYAKIHKSYEALKGGWSEDGLVDLTGGIGERIDLTKKSSLPKDLFDILLHDNAMNTLMGCSIHATFGNMETTLSNGLVIGHAYSVTKVAVIEDKEGYRHRLMRMRNPWGAVEWNGAWSDRSKKWNTVDEEIKRKVGAYHDGEFWMLYEDWLDIFEEIQICFLSPEDRLTDKRSWKETKFEGEWTKGVNAGGPTNSDTYWSNPQYVITLKDPDEDDDEKKCTLIVSLMQKYSRVKRNFYRKDWLQLQMSLNVYMLKSQAVRPDDENYKRDAVFMHTRGEKNVYHRETTSTFKLLPGTYLIVPNLKYEEQEGKFLLRCYTEKDPENTRELDTATEPIKPPKPAEDVLVDLFYKYAGDDKVVDARELQSILNEGYSKELGSEHTFDLESCRSMLAMMDSDHSGVLEWNEVQKMWNELNFWKGTFQQFDKDHSGTVDVKELKRIFNSIGFKLSKRVLSSIVKRYGGKQGRLAFNDFIMAITKVTVHLNIFSSHSKDDGLSGRAKFSLEEYMEVALYF